MVKPGTATWRLWLGLGLVALGTLSAVLSIGRNLMLIFLALSVLMVLAGLVQFSLWSKLRRPWL
jgi:hypothetical protein